MSRLRPEAMRGRRRPDGTAPWNLRGGDYCRRKGNWWVCCPNGNGPARLTGNGRREAPNWEVTEHDDGTITVSPSIEAHAMGELAGYWHGFLRAGVWSEA